MPDRNPRECLFPAFVIVHTCSPRSSSGNGAGRPGRLRQGTPSVCSRWNGNWEATTGNEASNKAKLKTMLARGCYQLRHQECINQLAMPVSRRLTQFWSTDSRRCVLWCEDDVLELRLYERGKLIAW